MAVTRLVGLVTAVVGALALATPAFAQDPPPQEHQMAGTGEYPRFRLAGFGYVNLSHQDRDEGPRGFSLGQFVLHMSSQLSSRVTFFGEISFSARADAGTGTPSATGFNVEVERMIVRFDQSDMLRVSFGRYHTPINYWNTAFHHGQWLQTTINRPEMIQFGGRFLPVHFIGALVEGAVPAGGLNIGYKGGIGNGRAGVISRGGDAGDVNDDPSYLANVVSKPDALYGLEVGGSFYADTIGAAAGPKVSEQIIAAHAAYQKETPELIAEFAAVRHDQGNGVTLWSQAYYAQAAYRFGFDQRKWKGYYRFEHIRIPVEDVAFAGIPVLRDSSTVGLRYEASTFAALKVEYRTWRRESGSPRDHGGYFQVAFTF